MQVKGHIKKHNKEFTSAVKDLNDEGFRTVGIKQLRKNISHVSDEAETTIR